MKFMIIRKADGQTEAGVAATDALISAMMSYNEEMARAGVFLQGVGLRPSDRGARVTMTAGGETSVTDGPFTETKELIAGFTIIEAKSKEEAIEWVKRWPAIDAPVQLEIRQVYDPADFGEEAAARMRALDERSRTQGGGDTR